MNLNNKEMNETVTVYGQVTKKIETAGPTIFLVNTGTSVVTAKLFKIKSDIGTEEYVKLTGNVSEYQGQKEVSIKQILRSPEAKEKMQAQADEVAKPPRTQFKAKAEYLDKLHDEFVKAATIIRKAVFAQRPILIRHHCDVDGFSGGLQIEKAIQEIADPKYRLRRSTMRAPFYEMEDILRDIAMAESDGVRWGEQPPLVVILDNGSSTQDVDALFLGREHGMDFIVVDHHVFGERDAITPITLAHINQLRVGDYETCTGFLAFELARMISGKYGDHHDIPAFAGISDRVEDKVIDYHLENASADRELLTQYEKVLTWLLGKVPFMDNTAMLQKFFFCDTEYKKKIIAQYLPQLEEAAAQALAMLEQVAETHQVGSAQVTFVPASVLPRRSYPKVGMATGLLFDKMKETNKASVVIGLMEDGCILRVAPESHTDVHKIIKYLDDNLHYPVFGGGHAVAGSAKFARALISDEERRELKDKLLEHVKELN